VSTLYGREGWTRRVHFVREGGGGGGAGLSLVAAALERAAADLGGEEAEREVASGSAGGIAKCHTGQTRTRRLSASVIRALSLKSSGAGGGRADQRAAEVLTKLRRHVGVASVSPAPPAARGGRAVKLGARSGRTPWTRLRSTAAAAAPWARLRSTGAAAARRAHRDRLHGEPEREARAGRGA